MFYKNYYMYKIAFILIIPLHLASLKREKYGRDFFVGSSRIGADVRAG